MQDQLAPVVNLSSLSSSSKRQLNLRQLQHSVVLDIQSDEDEQIRIKATCQDLYFKYQIAKAQTGGNKLDLLIVIQRITFPGQLTAKIEAQKQYFIEYFQRGANINIQSGFFDPRIDAGLVQNPGQYLQNQLLIYGIDLLETHDIINRFFRQNPKVSWINASHCLLTFQRAQLVSQFLENQCTNRQDILTLPIRNWTQIRGYRFLNIFQRKIYARTYTQADREHFFQLEKNDEIYQKFRRINKQVDSNLLKNEMIRKMFQQVISEDVISKMIGPNSFRKRKKSTMQKMYGDRSSFIRHPEQPGRHREKNYQHYQQNKSRSPQHKQHYQSEKYRYTLDYYNKYYIPGLKNNKQKQMKARERRRDPVNNQILQPVDLHSKMLKKKHKPNQQLNINKALNGIFQTPLFDQAQIIAPDQRQRADMQPNNQVFDTSFHLDDSPKATKNKCELQKLLERVDQHQNEQPHTLIQNHNFHNNLNPNNFNNNSSANVFQRPYKPNNNYLWTNNKISSNNQFFQNKSSNSGSISNLNSRFNRLMPFASSNQSSIAERSLHQIDFSNQVYNSQAISSNNLSHHHFSSNNSKPKIDNYRPNFQNPQHSNRGNSSSGIQSNWVDSIGSKERSRGQGFQQHSQSDCMSHKSRSKYMQNSQGVKRQDMPFRGYKHQKSFRSNNIKPAPASIPELQNDLFADNEKLQNFESVFQSGFPNFKYQPKNEFFH